MGNSIAWLQQRILWLLQSEFDGIWRILPASILIILIVMLLRSYFTRRFQMESWKTLTICLCVILVFPNIYSSSTFVKFEIPNFFEARSGIIQQIETIQPKIEQIQRQKEIEWQKTEASVIPNTVESATPATETQNQYMENKSATQSKSWIELPALPDITPVLIWATGAMLFWLYYIVQYLRLQWYLHKGRHKIIHPEILSCYDALFQQVQQIPRSLIFCKPKLYCHTGLPSAMCVGLLRKTIYLDTQNRSQEEIYWILRHELTHIAVQDMGTKVLLLCVRGLYWFHPLVYWLVKNVEKALEITCDERTVEDASLEERKAYSMAILNSVREGNHKRRLAKLSTALVEDKETLKERLERILYMKERKRDLWISFCCTIFILVLFNLVGCSELSSTTQQSQAHLPTLEEQLYDAKISYIGDASGVGKILTLLPLPKGLEFDTEGIELVTDAEPYGAIHHIKFSSDISEAEKEAAINSPEFLERNAYLFLALVENADFLEYQVHDRQNADTTTVFRYDRESAKQYFGDMDLRALAADETTFENFTQELNHILSVAWENSIRESRELDLARQEEKQAMIEENISILANIPMGTDYAAWVEQIRAQTAYDTLLKLDDDTLAYCLTQFATGNGLSEDSYGYTLMLLANQLAYGVTNTAEELQRTPTEWFAAYQALDSFAVAPFYKGMEEVYAQSSNATEYMILSDAAKDSRVNSKEEEVQAVYAALSDVLGEADLSLHDLKVFAPLIMDIVKTDTTMQVCCVIGENDYHMVRVGLNPYFVNVSGARTPARLDFVKQNDEWVMTEIHMAQDGSNYASSIEEMTPSDKVAKEMISFDQEEITSLLYENLIIYCTENEFSPIVYDTSYLSDTLRTELQRFFVLIPEKETDIGKKIF